FDCIGRRKAAFSPAVQSVICCGPARISGEGCGGVSRCYLYVNVTTSRMAVNSRTLGQQGLITNIRLRNFDMSLPSYTCGPQTNPLLPMTIGAAFDRAVERFSDREALVVRHQNLRYTWAQLAEEVDRCARGLLALGLQAGERVGIWSPNNAQWCITQFA